MLFYLLIAASVILAVMAIAMICAALFSSPKTRQFQSHEDEATAKAIRNRAWDAAVARARNRNRESY